MLFGVFPMILREYTTINTVLPIVWVSHGDLKEGMFANEYYFQESFYFPKHRAYFCEYYPKGDIPLEKQLNFPTYSIKIPTNTSLFSSSSYNSTESKETWHFICSIQAHPKYPFDFYGIKTTLQGEALSYSESLGRIA